MRVHDFVLAAVTLVSLGCAPTEVPQTPLTPAGQALVVSDERMVATCRYLGDASGSAATLDGARNDALNRAAALGATNLLFVSQTPGTYYGPYAKVPDVTAGALGRAYRCGGAAAADAGG